MRKLVSLAAVAAIALVPLAVPTASYAVFLDSPVAVPDTAVRSYQTLAGTDVGALPGDDFGYSVASDGNTLVVGARYAQTDSRGDNLGNGAIFIYNRSGQTWTFAQRIDAPAGIPTVKADGARFGQAVAISGDTIAVGAPYETRTGFSPNPDQVSAGAVYVYSRTAGTWSGTPAARLVDPSPENLLHDTRFGSAVALSGDMLAVGGPGKYLDNLAGQDKAGIAVVFDGSGGSWDAGTVLTDATPTPQQEFGTSVGLTGNALLVGVPNGITASGKTGRVASFTKGGSGWTMGPDVNPPGLVVGDQYGFRMTVAADNALIAAISAFPDLTFPAYPKLMQFALAGAAWSFVAANTAADPGPYGAFVADSFTVDAADWIYGGQPTSNRVDIWGPEVPLSTARNTTVTVAAPGVLANDYLPAFRWFGFDMAQVSLISPPANGTVGLSADGSFSYTPNANFVGTDAFQYRIDALRPSGTGAPATTGEPIPAADNAPLPSDPTTVTIQVTPTYDLNYAAGPGGTVTGATSQVVAPGGNGTTVTAVANPGWRFLRWSDGVTTATRTDTNVTGNISVTAQFEAITFTLTYLAGAHGSISGLTPQQVPWGGNGATVTAVPMQGSRFVRWSDGVTNATRTDTNVLANLSVTAQFEQLPLDLRATAVSHRTKFKLEVLTSCDSQFRFQIEKRHKRTTQRGSDEPVVSITWKKLKGTYTTKGTNPHTKTVNLPKGTYRAVVIGSCGYQDTTSNEVTLKR